MKGLVFPHDVTLFLEMCTFVGVRNTLKINKTPANFQNNISNYDNDVGFVLNKLNSFKMVEATIVICYFTCI